MKPISGKKMCKVLEARGWWLAETKSSHFLYVRTGSTLKIPVPVHGNRDLRTGTQRSIMRLAGLTDADL
ncbi:MAG: type II toxin-antitoxin system HicA family toxin [Planctomycetia bacterium]|nr:type II toxin-antitoxin system HicA family toxin [Planctomycetia bacterium]